MTDINEKTARGLWSACGFFDLHVEDIGLPGNLPAGMFPYSTGFSKMPMPSISQRTTSPGCMYRVGWKAIPTPEGVPMATMVPALSVMP